MNIQYADTPSQKQLKRMNAERQRFQTREYRIGCSAYSSCPLGPNFVQTAFPMAANRPILRQVYTPFLADSSVTRYP
jgi:hypothetical protein